MEQKLFIRHPEEWQWCFGESHRLEEPAGVKVVENGVILPPRPIPETELPYSVIDIVCRGGVCDESLEFVAGHNRGLDGCVTNLDCAGSYHVDEADIELRHERVLFGGVLYNHFGHAIVDSLTRLWYTAVSSDYDKVVFLRFPYDKFLHSHYDPMQIIGLIGIPDEKIEIIEAPTRFDCIIVPDEAFRCFYGHTAEFKLLFDDICSKLHREGTPKKVYLSHCAVERQLADKGMRRHVLNEEFFEAFYARRGFEVVYPEQHSFEEQVQLVHGADEIVMTIGTLSHLLLFAKPDVVATILIRNEPMFMQTNIDQAAGIDPYYVDVANNPLPINQGNGPSLLMPNRFFKEYLDARGIEYGEDELNISDGEKDALLLEFLREWAAVYRQPHAANHEVADKTLFDVVRGMNDYLFGTTFDEGDYREANRLAEARKERDIAVAEIKRLKGSTSWKLTKPVRTLKDLAMGLRER